MKIKEQATKALEELKTMEKTLENTKEFTSIQLAHIASYWHQTYGTPYEEFEAMLKDKQSNLAQDTQFVISFYQRILTN